MSTQEKDKDCKECDDPCDDCTDYDSLTGWIATSSEKEVDNDDRK